MAIVLTFSMAGCATVTFTGDGFSGNGGKRSVKGKGEMTTVSFPCGDFSKLTVEIFGELYYTAEESDDVTIELQENLVEYLAIKTDNGTLTIDSERSFNITDDSKNPKIYVSAPMLEKLQVDGLITIKKADKITADSFELDLSGICDGKLDLDVKELNADISGMGNIVLTGTADNAHIEMSGTGNFEAIDLQTKETIIDTSGMGNVEISCSDKLTVDISGIGGVTYKGNPSVSPTITGMGKLTKSD